MVVEIVAAMLLGRLDALPRRATSLGLWVNGLARMGAQFILVPGHWQAHVLEYGLYP